MNPEYEFELIETPIFTKQISHVLSDEAYGELQRQLIAQPDQGVIIPGSHGIRKLRWSLNGKRGKRGGIRVLYYLYLSEHQIYLLYLFKKSEKSDLSFAQLNELKKYVSLYLKG